MKVEDLIAQLQAFPADLPVLVEGFEDGWDGVLELRQARVSKVLAPDTWDGEFSEPNREPGALWEPPEKTGEPIPVLLMVGRRGARRGDTVGGESN